MRLHSSIENLIGRFQRREIHAAHSGRELVRALTQLAADSQTDSVRELADEIDAAVDQLLPYLPAYAPPVNVLNQFLARLNQGLAEELGTSHLKAELAALGERYQTWSLDARSRIGSAAFELIPPDSSLFTFTLSETVLSSLTHAWSRGKRFRVTVTESRPNDDGLETARRLAGLGVPVTVSIDACLSELVGQSTLALGGAESISIDGSAVCKVGMYLVALAAREHNVPLYILADTMKFDLTSRLGIEQPLDPLEPADIPGVAAEPATQIGGHLFDRTPGHLIRGVVTERGVLSPTACADLMRRTEPDPKLIEKLRSRPTVGFSR